MASHKSAQKRVRQTTRRTARNITILSKTKSAIRAFRKALTNSSDGETLKAAFDKATRELRRTASKGVLHANNASRRVSRLSKAFQQATQK